MDKSVVIRPTGNWVIMHHIDRNNLDEDSIKVLTFFLLNSILKRGWRAHKKSPIEYNGDVFIKTPLFFLCLSFCIIGPLISLEMMTGGTHTCKQLDRYRAERERKGAMRSKWNPAPHWQLQRKGSRLYPIMCVQPCAAKTCPFTYTHSFFSFLKNELLSEKLIFFK